MVEQAQSASVGEAVKELPRRTGNLQTAFRPSNVFVAALTGGFPLLDLGSGKDEC